MLTIPVAPQGGEEVEVMGGSKEWSSKKLEDSRGQPGHGSNRRCTDPESSS